MAARYVNDVDIARAKRDFELKKAVYDQEVQTQKAIANLAYQLQVSSYYVQLAMYFHRSVLGSQKQARNQISRNGHCRY